MILPAFVKQEIVKIKLFKCVFIKMKMEGIKFMSSNNQIKQNPFKQLLQNNIKIIDEINQLQNKKLKNFSSIKKREILSYKAAIEIIKKFQEIKKQES